MEEDEGGKREEKGGDQGRGAGGLATSSCVASFFLSHVSWLAVGMVNIPKHFDSDRQGERRMAK